jgi:hypothetical protein
MHWGYALQKVSIARTAVLVLFACQLVDAETLAVINPISKSEPTMIPLLTLGLVMLLAGRLLREFLAKRVTPKHLREVFLEISRWLSMPMQFQPLRRCVTWYEKALAWLA